ncbi:TonB-dependent siderophore receptor [Janthinobacterium fluminis]|uniref:TonB-dependent siderophore receptor n=1 Tax=Janthinobacterium fluminis TaxID=2987524 RepID=A0ABT5K4S6_9BURK|nr:TonB-dependent siderophore receptor [Janthinobacterium fluminis]MDC8759690.1 TonB-dependent siderophore receptor [Janthinobacterium fluminis]
MKIKNISTHTPPPPRRSALALQFALAGLSLGGAAHAQQAGVEAAHEARRLPAVTVTAGANTTTEGSHSYTTGGSTAATGLNLSIRDTPQSVTVVTRERIDDQAMQSVFDVVNNTTGVSAKPIDSVRDYYYARGFQVDSVQIDGTPMSGSNAGEAKADMAIYDRVEIVRGATGLLNGAGSPSASVNLVRKHADSKTFTGAASVGLGSWGQRNGSVDLTTPLNGDGSVRARFVAGAERKNSFIDLENTRKTVFYGVLDADLSPDTHLSVGISEQRDTRRGSHWAGLPIWYSDGSRTNWGRSKTAAADWNYWATQQRTGFVTLEHRLANQWTLKAVASQRNNAGQQRLNWMDSYYMGRLDRATGFGLVTQQTAYDLTEKQSDFGVHAAGPFELLGRKHELAAGLMHGKHKLHWLMSEPPGSMLAADFNKWTGAYPEETWPAYATSQKDITTQTSAYAAARLQVSDTLKVISGARVSNWSKRGEVVGKEYTMRHNGVVTPYLGLVYDLGAQSSLYASYTDIFDPQDKRDRNGNYLKPLVGKNYEVGAKGELLDGKLNASFALFRIEQDNMGVRDGDQTVPDTKEAAYKTADGTKTQGYEFELSGELAPGWNMSLGWTQFTAKDAAGKAINTDHPHKMLKLFSKYRLRGEWSKLAVGGGVNWEGRSYDTLNNIRTGAEEQVGQGAYAVASLMAHYEISKQLSVQVNVNNVFDKKYYNNQIGVFKNLSYGAPRKLLATLKYTF